MVDYVAFGRRLRRERKKCGLSQLALGGKVGVSGKHISNIETGKTIPGIEVVIGLANALEVSLDLLFADSLTFSNRKQCIEIDKELEGCSLPELEYLNGTINNMKMMLRSYDKNVKKQYKKIW